MTLEYEIDFALADSLLGKDWGPLEPYWNSCRELVLDKITDHRLENLFFLSLKGMNCPENFKHEMQRTFVANKLWEDQHFTILKRVLSGFSQKNIHPLLFKGTALAYSLYPAPVARDRGDTDILVRPEDFSLASDILLDQDFTTQPNVGDKYNMEREFVFVDKFGLRHLIDLHKQINSCQAYAKNFPYQTLAANAVSIPFGDNQVNILGPVDAMLIASFHYHEALNSSKYKHHPANTQILLWLYDLHILSQNFTNKHWVQLLDIANKTGLSRSCFKALDLSLRYFDSNINLTVLEKLQDSARHSAIDKFLIARHTQRWRHNIAHQKSFRNKLGMLFEVLFPNTEFMKAKYPNAWPSWIIFLYFRRLLSIVLARLWSS